MIPQKRIYLYGGACPYHPRYRLFPFLINAASSSSGVTPKSQFSTTSSVLYLLSHDPSEDAPHGDNGEDKPMNPSYADLVGMFDSFPLVTNRLYVLMISLRVSTQPELSGTSNSCQVSLSVFQLLPVLRSALLGSENPYHLACFPPMLISPRRRCDHNRGYRLGPRPLRAPSMVHDPQKQRD